MQLFYSDKRLQEIFFQNHPPPPEELHGRPLSCLVPQLVPGPHYYSARPERLGSRGPNEDPNAVHVVQTKNKQMAEKSVDGKGFVFFYRGFCTDSSLPFKRETYN